MIHFERMNTQHSWFHYASTEQVSTVSWNLWLIHGIVVSMLSFESVGPGSLLLASSSWRCSSSILDWSVTGCLRKLMRISCVGPGVTHSLCPRLVDSCSLQAQGPKRHGRWSHTQLGECPQPQILTRGSHCVVVLVIFSCWFAALFLYCALYGNNVMYAAIPLKNGTIWSCMWEVELCAYLGWWLCYECCFMLLITWLLLLLCLSFAYRKWV